eukprot:SAG31_NODE_336_length_17493_cov_20.694032_15_plen_79_part_00
MPQPPPSPGGGARRPYDTDRRGAGPPPPRAARARYPAIQPLLHQVGRQELSLSGLGCRSTPAEPTSARVAEPPSALER